jgi:hypothetical protein
VTHELHLREDRCCGVVVHVDASLMCLARQLLPHTGGVRLCRLHAEGGAPSHGFVRRAESCPVKSPCHPQRAEAYRLARRTRAKHLRTQGCAALQQSGIQSRRRRRMASASRIRVVSANPQSLPTTSDRAGSRHPRFVAPSPSLERPSDCNWIATTDHFQAPATRPCVFSHLSLPHGVVAAESRSAACRAAVRPTYLHPPGAGTGSWGAAS